jgi:metal-responsive CopG/Arc/MetJ family transcriptional regulator
MGPLEAKPDEGPLEVITLKIPKKLKGRVDAAAKTTGNNRSQTILALVRWGLDEFERQRAAEKKDKE